MEEEGAERGGRWEKRMNCQTRNENTDGYSLKCKSIGKQFSGLPIKGGAYPAHAWLLTCLQLFATCNKFIKIKHHDSIVYV